MIKILSLDLQGTLSDSNFSDYFWLELLPLKYSKKFNISLNTSKEILKNKFKEYGKYNVLYYDDKYWANYLEFNTIEELNNFEIRPKINNKLFDYLNDIYIPKIIISTTTNLFINYELKDKIYSFKKIYSCIDYFNSGGKTKEVFLKVCKELNVKPGEILHIGDSQEMDFSNAKKAGLNALLYKSDVDKLKTEIEKYMED